MKPKNGSTPADAPKPRPVRPATAKGTAKAAAAAGDRKPRARSGGRGAARGAKGPSAGEISRRAYEIFLERGGTHGRDFDDWVEAERQLRKAEPESGD